MIRIDKYRKNWFIVAEELAYHFYNRFINCLCQQVNDALIFFLPQTIKACASSREKIIFFEDLAFPERQLFKLVWKTMRLLDVYGLMHFL